MSCYVVLKLQQPRTLTFLNAELFSTQGRTMEWLHLGQSLPSVSLTTEVTAGCKLGATHQLDQRLLHAAFSSVMII